MTELQNVQSHHKHESAWNGFNARTAASQRIWQQGIVVLHFARVIPAIYSIRSVWDRRFKVDAIATKKKGSQR